MLLSYQSHCDLWAKNLVNTGHHLSHGWGSCGIVHRVTRAPAEGSIEYVNVALNIGSLPVKMPREVAHWYILGAIEINPEKQRLLQGTFQQAFEHSLKHN
jgi:hypothetical protein